MALLNSDVNQLEAHNALKAAESRHNSMLIGACISLCVVAESELHVLLGGAVLALSLVGAHYWLSVRPSRARHIKSIT